jgi:YXWGXW repeat-containing protein
LQYANHDEIFRSISEPAFALAVAVMVHLATDYARRMHRGTIRTTNTMKFRSLALIGLLLLTVSLGTSFAQVDVSVSIAPPVLPVVEQPPCPVEGYIWTPGYWAYDSDYYWVPGAWVAPPSVGLLWTPPWWGWNNGVYVFNTGYWGPTVGFYGGINYGFGYTGNGYWGGRWVGNSFHYNTYVSNVNKTVIHNTYVDRNVNKQVTNNRASFNGPNGVKAHETAEQKAAAANAKKMGPTAQQQERQNAAKSDPQLHAKNNNGHPNQEAIKSFNQTHGQGKGAEGAGMAAGAGKGENKTGNMAEHRGQGAGMNGEEHGNQHEAANLHGNEHNPEGNQAKAHGKSMEHQGNAHGQQHAMNNNMGAQHNKMGAQHNQQMHAQHNMQMGPQHHPQQMMGAQHHPQMQGGGNRPHPGGGQPQGKKPPPKNEHH